jgi:hypothetical protein
MGSELTLAVHLMEQFEKPKEGVHLTPYETLIVIQAYAAIAQAEAAQRQAAASERIADATERRNELLAEFNKESKASAATHTEKLTEGVNSLLDALFGKGEQP